MAHAPGGFGKTMNATEETQYMCNLVKVKVEGKTNQAYVDYTAVKYRMAIVAGENLLFKVHVGGVNYIHLSVFKALPCNGGGVTLNGVEQDKTKDDPLTPFNS